DGNYERQGYGSHYDSHGYAYGVESYNQGWIASRMMHTLRILVRMCICIGKSLAMSTTKPLELVYLKMECLSAKIIGIPYRIN
ncbi:hypothetical protein J1N35_022390, partial [Gossypium stocksii]